MWGHSKSEKGVTCVVGQTFTTLAILQVLWKAQNISSWNQDIIVIRSIIASYSFSKRYCGPVEGFIKTQMTSFFF